MTVEPVPNDFQRIHQIKMCHSTLFRRNSVQTDVKGRRGDNAKRQAREGGGEGDYNNSDHKLSFGSIGRYMERILAICSHIRCPLNNVSTVCGRYICGK